MPNQTLTKSWSDGASTSSYRVPVTATTRASLGDTVPGGSNNAAYSLTIDHSTLESLFIVSTRDATLAINGVNDVQTLTPAGSYPGTDSFKLTFLSQQTGLILMGSDGPTVGAAFQALSSVGTGNCNVTGPAGGPWRFEFVGALAYSNPGAITVSLITSPDIINVVHTTTGSAADQTFTLLAGNPILWSDDGYFSNPLTHDVTRLSFTIAGTAAAAIQVEALYS